MIGGQRVLAIVPARGGSKGIPLKNLRPVLGVPMITRVAHVLKSLPAVDRSVVSTDHDEIAQAAEAAGLSAPFRRPHELSGDCVSDLEVLTHALTTTEKIDGVIYDLVVMLQPTSPLRKSEHVSAAIEMLVRGNWDAVWTVSQTDSKNHPAKQLTLHGDYLDYHSESGKDIIARQQLAPVYQRNGVAYVVTRDCLLNQRSIKGHRTAGLVLQGNFVSIDTEWDITLVEFIMSSSGWVRGNSAPD